MKTILLWLLLFWVWCSHILFCFSFVCFFSFSSLYPTSSARPPVLSSTTQTGRDAERQSGQRQQEGKQDLAQPVRMQSPVRTATGSQSTCLDSADTPGATHRRPGGWVSLGVQTTACVIIWCVILFGRETSFRQVGGRNCVSYAHCALKEAGRANSVCGK